MTQKSAMNYQVPMFATVIVAAVFTMIVYMGTDLSVEIDSSLATVTTQLGFGIGGNALMALALALSLIAAISVEKRISWSIRISWSLYATSVLYYTKVDLTHIIGQSMDFSIFRNSFPEVIIMLNGVILMAATLLSRSYLGVSGIRENLLGRGAKRAEVDAVCSKNMGFLLPLIFGPCVLAMLLWYLSGTLLSGNLLVELAKSEAYFGASLIAALVLLAVFVSVLVGKGEPDGDHVGD